MYFFHLPPTLSDIYPLQVENCDTNSRLVVDKDDNSKFRFERVNTHFQKINGPILLLELYGISTLHMSASKLVQVSFSINDDDRLVEYCCSWEYLRW